MQRWTLKSTLVRLQGQFLHTLTYKHMSIQFDTAQQGSGTVQDLLNKLTRATAQMVQYPDRYTLKRMFVVALQEPLHHAVLMQGLTPEFNSLAELANAARQIEEAMCYYIGLSMSQPTDHLDLYPQVLLI